MKKNLGIIGGGMLVGALAFFFINPIVGILVAVGGPVAVAIMHFKSK